MDIKYRNGEKFEIFSNFLAHPVETPWLILTVLHQNVRRSVPYILDYIWHRWENPTGGGGTSTDIVPTQIIFGVDPCTRCWDIAQKPPKCKNSPLTPIVTKISFAPFSARRGPPTPKRGEVTSRPRLRPHANFGVNWPAGCWEIVDRTKNKQKNIQ